MNKTSIVGILGIMIGIIYSFQAYHLPKAAIGNEWAPIYFPLGIGVLMTLFGVVLLIKGLIESKNQEAAKNKLSFSYTAKLITYTSIVSIIYALLFERIGYVLSTILFMGAILFVVNQKQWKTNLIVSITFSLVIYTVFSKFLGISLPIMPYIEF